jgi:alpha-D-ribose 1-methylphosphonate 5-triphosphate synthase subunit PhnI
MGYIAVHGGTLAIENAEKLTEYSRLKGSSTPVSVQQILDQMRLLVDRVMGEGGLYSPFHAALALKQSEGDPIEASFYLRAYRSTLRRIADSLPIDTQAMRLSRRISSAFKSIPGGQILGSTSDYRQRILDFSLLEETDSSVAEKLRELTGAFDVSSDSSRASESDNGRMAMKEMPKVLDILRRQELVPTAEQTESEPAVDVTKVSVTYPLHRSGRLQMMARAETGGLLAVAYSNMRGYGSVHPTIAELRVGRVDVEIPHPYRREETVVLGSIQITEVEILSSFRKGENDDKPKFTLGYGICFGHNELKGISIAVLDRSLKSEEPNAPSEDQEFVLYHTDGIESSGFCSHFKLPHYVTFQSALDRLRESQKASENPDLVMQQEGGDA